MRRTATAVVTAATAAIPALAGTGPAFAQATGQEPAGGAAAAEAIGATVGAVVVTALIGALIAAHRAGRIRFLDRLAHFTERQTGLPGWAALPSALMGASLLTAALGMYWDISLHIDNGRDDGPLANPAHYLILFGLYGALVAGALSFALAGRERPCATAVHLGAGWWAPLGGLMIAACGAFALTGFPLDDLWHRLFGQDVTLWGPTHLMLIGGGSLATLGGMVLMAEAAATLGRDPERGGPKQPAWPAAQGADLGRPAIYHVRRALLVGGFLVALSTFQGEFDFGVPQFRQIFHPVLIMLAAGVGLVAARLYLGRGGALLAVLGFVLIRGFIALMVGGVWGQTTPHFPLYLVEALLVEAVFVRQAAGERPVASGAVAGALIGTVGLAAEWAWSQVWMPISWTSALLPEAVVAGLATGIAGGMVGGFVGGALTSPGGEIMAEAAAARHERLPRTAKLAALAAGVAIMAVVAWGLPLSEDGPRSASVTLRDLSAGPDREVAATVRLEPADAVDEPEFFNVTAWQGGGSVVAPLERIGPGEYRTTKPIPVYGGWKANVRLQQGEALVAVPIFLPRDEAIPAPEVPARASFTRPFRADLEVLQRERKEGVSGLLTTGAYLTVLAIALSLFALLAWALLRVEASGGRRPRERGGDRRAQGRRQAVHAELV